MGSKIMLLMLVVLVMMMMDSVKGFEMCKPTNPCLECLEQGIRNWYCSSNGSYCLPLDQDPPSEDFGFVLFYPSKVCPRQIKVQKDANEGGGGGCSVWWMIAAMVLLILLVITVLTLTGIWFGVRDCWRWMFCCHKQPGPPPAKRRTSPPPSVDIPLESVVVSDDDDDTMYSRPAVLVHRTPTYPTPTTPLPNPTPYLPIPSSTPNLPTPNPTPNLPIPNPTPTPLGRSRPPPVPRRPTPSPNVVELRPNRCLDYSAFFQTTPKN